MLIKKQTCEKHNWSSKDWEKKKGHKMARNVRKCKGAPWSHSNMSMAKSKELRISLPPEQRARWYTKLNTSISTLLSLSTGLGETIMTWGGGGDLVTVFFFNNQIAPPNEGDKHHSLTDMHACYMPVCVHVCVCVWIDYIFLLETDCQCASHSMSLVSLPHPQFILRDTDNSPSLFILVTN